jgi:hypothetical protein
MDVNSFAQCLSYVATISKATPLYEKLLPVATTIIGIAVGFLLNIAKESKKEKRETQEKKDCIATEINRMKQTALACYKVSLKILDTNMQQKSSNGHSMPGRVEPILIQEYFKSVAHTYPTETQGHILHMLDLAATLSALCAISRSNPSSIQEESEAAANVFSNAVFCYAICDAILNNTQPDYRQQFDIAKRYDIKSTYLDQLKTNVVEGH